MAGHSDTDDNGIMDEIHDLKYKPRHMFVMPSQMIMLIKRNNELMESIIKRMDAGINGPWLRTAEAAQYLRVSKSHLLINLRDKKIKSYTGPGNITVYNIADLDAYWFSRENKT